MSWYSIRDAIVISPFRLLIACGLSLSASSVPAVAVEADRWRVEIRENFVILRAPETIDHGLMQVTMKALADAGLERIVLRKLDPNDKLEVAPGMCVIQVVGGKADITASADVPKEFLEVLSTRLEKAGIKSIDLEIVGVG